MSMDIGKWVARMEANNTGFLGDAFLGVARIDNDVAIRKVGGDGPRISYSLGEDFNEHEHSGRDVYILRRNFHNGEGKYVQESVKFDLQEGEFQNRIYVGQGSEYRTALTRAFGHHNSGFIGSAGGFRVDINEDGSMKMFKPFDENERIFIAIENDTESPFLKQFLREGVEKPEDRPLSDPRAPGSNTYEFARGLITRASNDSFSQLDITDADPQTVRKVVAHTIWDITRRTGFPEQAPDSVKPLLRELHQEAEADYQRSLTLPNGAPTPGNAPNPGGYDPVLP